MKTTVLKKSLEQETVGSKTGMRYRRGGGLLSGFMLAMLAAGPAVAGPTGGNVVAGEGTITGSGALTQIDQATHRLAINWDTFNVAANETVRFVQPSSTSVALNTIFDQNPSQIFGVIDANGRVLLINPNGMIFGPTAQVNVAGLVASSLNISTDDFMAGNYAFEGGAGGLVLNQGSLQAASGGFIALLGNAVANEGLIVAEAGTIAMGAGETVALDFDGTGLMYFAVESEVLDAALGADSAVSNSGELFADGGRVLLTADAAQDVYTQAINNEGLIRARRIENEGGVIRLSGGSGTVVSTGAIDADGGDEQSTGGSVELLGNKVGVGAGATVTADGVAGGGTVLVGGGVQGGGGLPTADYAYVGDGAVLSADALGEGDGGTVVVWAEEVARVYGDITARGGAAGGDGGFVETSGKRYLDFNGSVDASAANGAAGTWLLDPEDIEITTADANITQGGAGDPGPITFDPTAPDTVTTIDVANINTALNGGSNVTVSTASAGTTTPGNITVNAAIAKTADGGNADGSTLTLVADNNIDVNQSISSTTGLLNVDLQANGTIDIDANVTTNGGNFTATTGTITAFDSSGFAINTTGAADAAGGNVQVNATAITTGTITTTGGTATATGQAAGSVTLVGDVLNVGGITATGSDGAAGTDDGGAGGAIILGDSDTPPTSITLSGDIDTSGGAGQTQGAGGDVQVNGPAVLAANRTITTGATAGSVLFESSLDSADGGQSLVVTAGTGDVRFGTTGDTNALTSLNASGTNIELGGDITTNTAAGITLSGAKNLVADVTLDTSTNNGAVDLGTGNTTDTGTRALTIAAGSGQVDLAGVATGTLSAATTGNLNANGSITTDDATGTGIALTGSTVTLADAITLNSTNRPITLTADTLDDGLTTAINAGTGTVTLRPLTAANTIDICNEDGTNGCSGPPGETEYDLGSYSITAGSLLIGGAGQTGDIAMDAVTLAGAGQTYDLALQNAGVGAGISVDGDYSGQGLSLDSGDADIALGGDVVTNGGNAVFADDVALSGGAVVVNTTGTTDGNASFQANVNGGEALTVNAGAGSVSLAGVGQTTELTSLIVTGGTINLGGNIDTTGAAGVVLSGAKNLTADVTIATTNDDIDLGTGSTDGAQALTLAAGSGTISLGDVGQTTDLTSLTATATGVGGLISLGGDISTNGAAGIVLSGDKNLAADVTLTTTNDLVDLDTGAINGGQALTIVAGTGTVSLADVGQTTDLTSLSVTAGTINLGGDIDTTGAAGIVLSGAKNLTSSVALTTTDDLVDLDTGAINGGQGFTINAGTGTVSLADVGQTTDLASVNVTGGTINLGGDISTTGDAGIVLDGNKVLTADVVLTTTNDPVDLDAGSTDGAQALTIAAGTGAVSLGPTGQTTALTGLTVSSAGNLNLNGDVTTAIGGTGIDVDAASVALAANVDLASNGADITFATDNLSTAAGSTINAGAGTVALAPSDANSALAIEVCDGASCTGTAPVEYDVGGLTTVTAAQFQIGRSAHTGNMTLNAASPSFNLSLENGGTGGISVDGAFTGQGLELNSGSGGISLGANISTNGGAAVFADNVTLATTVAVDTTGTTDGDADFQGSVVSTDGSQGLSVTAGTGTVSLGDVGQGGAGNVLTALTATGGAINLGGSITTNTAGGITLSGAKTLRADVTLDSSAGNGAVNLGTGNTADAGTNDLVITAGSGQIDLAAVAAGSLTATTSGDLNAQGSITTDDAAGSGIALTGDTVALADAITLNSGGRPITLVANTLSDGPTTAINAGGGTVTIAPLDGTNTVDVCDEDAANGCAGSVADTQYDLESYAITAGTLQIGGAGQTGNIAVGTATLGAAQAYDLALQNAGAGNVSLAGPFNGNSLDVAAGGSITVNGAVATNGGDATFDAGTGINLNAGVTTAGGDAVFADDVVLGNAVAVSTSNGAASFQGDIDGANSLTVTAGSGAVTLNGVGQSTALTNLSVTTTGGIDLGGNITTGGNVLISGDKNLSASVTIDSSAGNGSVDLSTGNVTNTANEDLAIVSGSGNVSLANVDVNALSVTTTGTATLGAVTNTDDISVTAGQIVANGALSGNDVLLSASAAGIALPQVTAAGDLTVQAGGNIDDNGTIDVSGDAAFTSTGNVVLDQAASTFGSVALTAANATLVEADGTDLAGAAVTGSLTVTSGGNITDSDTLTVGGATVLSADGGAAIITLDDPASTFGTLSLTANNASVSENADTDLGASSVAGNLNVTSTGSISDSGTLTVGGQATLSAGGSLTLDQAASNFGSLSIAATSASVRENSSMNVVAADVGGALSLISAGAITGSGTVQASSLSTTSAGGMSLDADVGTFTATNTGSGDISLTNAQGLDVTGVSQTGDDVFISADGDLVQSGDISTDGGAVELVANGGSLTMVDGTSTVSSGGPITYSTTGAGGGDITLSTLRACDPCNAGGTGRIEILAIGDIIGHLRAVNDPHVTGVTALLDSGGDIGSNPDEGGQLIVFGDMPLTGDAQEGEPIHLSAPGNAYIFSNGIPFTSSGNVFDQSVANRETAASTQAAALEEEVDVNWAAYSEDITIYEINNEGIQLPEEEEEEDDFVMIEGEGVNVPIAQNR